PAAFGLARVRAERRDAAGAVEALDLVPRTSRGYPESRQLRAGVLLSQGTRDLAVLDQAMRSIEPASMDPATHGRYSVRILEQALAIVTTGGSSPAAVPAGE
ncbi:tetratricopeptide repeat protein, partial [Nocardioides sp. R-C-SC26]|uniref:tetratricopeptide repeat protein n=1 Tax=Nocardioides sp. R-C-SC26 TaxID=2870414 RepID=UPI0027E0D83F